MFKRVIVLAAFAALPTSALALEKPRAEISDPAGSGMWNYHQIRVLGDPEKISFDNRVKLSAPAFAEDSFNVPVLVDATEISDVEKIVLFVDYGPIPHILTYYPGETEPKLSFRFKIDQSTPVRAGVMTKDGAWHVGYTMIDASGGGCTAPAFAYASDDWRERLGNVHGQVWQKAGRVRAVVDHPMDTGLADGIPVFIITDLDLQTMDGEQLARLELHEPVNEDPAFTFYADPQVLPATVRLTGRDNNGNRIDAVLGEQVQQ